MSAAFQPETVLASSRVSAYIANLDQQRSSDLDLTFYLARLLGLFTIVTSLAILLNHAGIVAAIERISRDSTALLLVELIGLAVGVAMVLGHNVWHGGVLPIVVTLLGWLIFARSVVLLLLPPAAIDKIFEWAAWPKHANIYATISFVIGLFLTIMGFAG